MGWSAGRDEQEPQQRASRWSAGANDVSAPEGQRQAARAAEGFSRNDPQYRDSGVGRWTAENGFTSTLSSWFTGRNTQGVNNGWDSDFMRRSLDQQDRLAQSGQLNSWFDTQKNPDATGVVTWDHESSDGTKRRFGDVYDKGEFQGNLYDTYDRDTANLRMAAITLDGKQQERLNKDSDPMKAYDHKIREIREENRVNVPKAYGAAEFNAKVAKTQDKLDEGFWSELIGAVGAFGAGLATGASVAAGSTAVTGGAAAPAAPFITLGAGLLSAGGYLLNQDEMEMQAARVVEQTKAAADENGGVAAPFTALKGAGGLTLQAASPVSNIYKGVADAALEDSKIGDDKAGYYERTDTGERKANTAVRAGSLAAMAIDGFLQFGSQPARRLYGAGIGAHLTGGAGELALTGGMQFNDRSGQFEQQFTDDEGNFAPTRGAAAIGGLAIDAVQWGGIAGIARQTRLAREAAEAGRPIDRMVGSQFILDDAGKVVEAKRTLSYLAPSEQVARLTAKRDARKLALADGRSTVTNDDLYEAASRLAHSDNKIKASVVNAFGEGYEEALQATLEPYSFEGAQNFEDIAAAFAGGAAAGLGMSLGAMRGGPVAADRMKAAAQVKQVMAGRPEFTDEQWDAMSYAEKRVASSLSKAEIEAGQAAAESIVTSQAANLLAEEPEAARAFDAIQRQSASDLDKATTRTDQYIVQVSRLEAGRVDGSGRIRPGDVRPDALRASGRTILELLVNRQAGITAQVAHLTRELEQLAGKDQANEDVARQVAEKTQLLGQTQAVAKIGEQLAAYIGGLTEELYSEGANTAALVREINGALVNMYDGKVNLPPEMLTALEMTEADARKAAAKWASLLHSREPKLSTNSFHSFLPQVSLDFTLADSDNVLDINLDYQKSLNGDFDGDKLRAENQIILDDEHWVQSRSGEHFGGAGQKLDMATYAFEQKSVDILSEGLLRSASDPVIADARKDAAETALATIRFHIRQRYSQAISEDKLERILDGFEDLVVAGSADARVTLINELVKAAGQNLVALGRATGSPEWLWISNLVRTTFADYQTAYSNHSELTQAARAASRDYKPAGKLRTPTGERRIKTPGATMARTLAIYLSGTDLFRKFQSIHYNAVNEATIESATLAMSDNYKLAMALREVSQQVTETQLAEVGAQSNIPGLVRAQLGRIAADIQSSAKEFRALDLESIISIIANVEMEDVWIEGDRVHSRESGLSLVQVLLKRAIEQDEKEHQATLHRDRNRQNMHAHIKSMLRPNRDDNDVYAQKAFLEVMKVRQFGQILGPDTGRLNSMQTVEQFLANYMVKDVLDQRAFKAYYLSDLDLPQREKRPTWPLSTKAVERGEATAKSLLLDAVFAVGNKSVTFDRTKTKHPEQSLTGDLVTPFKTAESNARAIHASIREAMGHFDKRLGLRKRKAADQIDLVRQMLLESGQQGKQMLEMMPDAAIAGLYEYDPKTKGLYLSDVLYKFFTTSDFDKAFMDYWWAIETAKYNATLMEVRKDNGKVKDGRNPDGIKDRFQLMLWRISQEPNRLHLAELQKKAKSARSLHEFFFWLNSTPGYRMDRSRPGDGIGLPFIPYNMDLVTFQPDMKSNWVSVGPTQDERTTLSELVSVAAELRDNQRERSIAEAANQIRRGELIKAYKNQTLDQTDVQSARQAFERAGRMRKSLSPTLLVQVVSGAMNSFDQGSTEKVKTPTSYAELGEMQVISDVLGFYSHGQRLQNAINTYDYRDLEIDPSVLFDGPGRAMLPSGRVIEWGHFDLEDPSRNTGITFETWMEMLEDLETAPLAQNLVVPKVVERGIEGTITERLAHDADLAGILDSQTTYEELFIEASREGRPTVNSALNYIRTVDSLDASGEFVVMRYFVDLAVTRLNALKHQLIDPEEQAAIVAQAALDTAEIWKLWGKILASPEMRNSDLGERIRDKAMRTLRSNRVGREAPEAIELLDSDIKRLGTALIGNIEGQVDQQIIDLVRKTDAGELDVDQADLQAAALRGVQAEITERLENLMDDNEALEAVRLYHLTGNDAVDAPKQALIAEAVLADPNFLLRAPYAATAVAHLNDTLAMSGLTQSKMKPEDWDVLSRTLMGMTLEDRLMRSADHVTTVPFFSARKDEEENPLESRERFFKYLDPEYTFLVRDVFDNNATTGAAAAELHALAMQDTEILDDAEVLRSLERGVLHKESLGDWTSDMYQHLVFVHRKIDAAASPVLTPAYGNAPKHLAPALASERTGNSDGLEGMVTPLAFSAGMIAPAADPFAEVEVTPFGAAASVSMPIGQLNNRFFSTIKLNGEELDLGQNNLGYVWTAGDPNVPLRYVAMSRLWRVVTEYATANDLDPATVQIEVEFLHPDSQPDSRAWVHNAYFEGMNHSQLPDISDSLIASRYSAGGGEIAAGTQFLIDAQKLGSSVATPFVQPDQDLLAEARRAWEEEGNLAKMLRLKTQIELITDEGLGEPDIENYNAIYKFHKMRHIVVGLKDGQRAALTADQVIARQVAGQELGFDEGTAKLIELSPAVLRAMVGDYSNQAVPQFPQDGAYLVPDRLDQFFEITDDMLAQFGDGWFAKPGTIADTPLVNVGRQKTLKPTRILSQTEA